MKQKFSKLSFVWVTSDLPPSMSHFPSGFIGIVKGTYSQLYGGKNIKQYSVYRVEKRRAINTHSWYGEEHLSLFPQQNKTLAEDLIEEYKLRG